MVAFCRVMVVIHFKIVMPMNWLARNNHLLGVRSHWISLVKMFNENKHRCSSRCLNLNRRKWTTLFEWAICEGIIDKFYTDANGSDVPLPPLQDAMPFKYEHGKVLPCIGLEYCHLTSWMPYYCLHSGKKVMKQNIVIELARGVAECSSPKANQSYQHHNCFSLMHRWNHQLESDHCWRSCWMFF